MTGVPENPVSISEGQTATAPSPPALTGYDFAEWYTEEAATNQFDFSQVITSSIDLYAKWNIQQFTITYHDNKPQDVTANVTGVPDTVNIEYNQPATVPTPPTLTGYNFVAWYTEATATNQFNFSQGITTSIDLYAKWSQDPVVTFDTQRGSTIEPQRLTGTIKRATRPQENPTREDYTFDNWYTQATGGTLFDFTQTITTQSTIVYARWNRIMRTVTYHGNRPDTVPRGVSVTNLPDPVTVNVNSGDMATPPATPPVLQDYVFQGWFAGTITGTTPALENTAFVFETTAIKADLLVFAKWNRVQITVTFHGRKPSTAPEGATITGLTTDPTIVTVNSGETTTAPIPAPELTGYMLDGWYKATSSTTGTVTLENTAFDFAQPVRGENINLYTKWLQQFTVTYHGNKPQDVTANVTGVLENPVSISDGQTAKAPTPPTLTDYNFVAWYTEATATNQFDFSQGITTSIDLYAKWSQDPVVTFDTQGGSAIEPQRLTGTTKRATRPDNDPTREDYTFENWYTTAETGTTQFNFDQDITAQSTIVYARWNRIARTVTYHGNKPDAVPRGVSVSNLPDPPTVNVDSGETTTAPIAAPELQDYVFQGWFAGTTGTTPMIGNTAFVFETTAIKENKDLYAKWTRKEINITFYGNKPSTAPEGATITGLTTDPTIITVNSGETTTAPEPELTGYTLDGWFIGTISGDTLALQDTAFDFAQPVRGENINLYAKWTKYPIVTFDTQGGSPIEPQRLTGTPKRATRPDNDPTREGYVFDDWYTMATGGDVFDFSATTPITASITVYAQWIQQFTVTYHGNKPSSATANVAGMPTNVMINYNLATAEPSPEPTLVGYTFEGWYTEQATTKKFVFTTRITANIDLYAKWVFRPSTKAELLAEINRAITPTTPSPNLNYIDTSLINDMSRLFQDNRDFNGNISSWNVSLVQNMSYMFVDARVFNQNISSWNVSKVTNMRNMFANAKVFNQNISSWNVSLVQNMSSMFASARVFNQNISSWNVSLVGDMQWMFHTAVGFNQNISSWNVSKVTNMDSMFRNATVFNQNISSWNVSLVQNMLAMFAGAKAFNQNISSWNVSKVSNMLDMFNEATAFNQNLSSWNVAKVTNMDQMFKSAFTFNGNISSWNVGLVQNMNQMFANAYAFNQNISSWNVAMVTNMEYMFYDAKVFNQNISSWNVDMVNSFSGFRDRSVLSDDNTPDKFK